MPPNDGPRRVDIPTAGWYLIRLVRGGPWVGAQIAHVEGQGWYCMIDGEWQGPAFDPWELPWMETIHWSRRPVTEQEVRYRIGLRKWLEINKPDSPLIDARKPIDLDKFIPN